MPPIVEQVAKGNRKAMLKVYESNKRAVYILCRLLLKDEAGASAAFTAVINELWSDLSVKEPGTEEELRRRAMELAVKHCKRKLFGKEQNQFKVAKITPVHQPEVQKAAYSGPVEAGLESLLSAISQMEVHQRFVYLAIAVGGLSVRETGKIVGQRENVVKYLYELRNFALFASSPTNPAPNCRLDRWTTCCVRRSRRRRFRVRRSKIAWNKSRPDPSCRLRPVMWF